MTIRKQVENARRTLILTGRLDTVTAPQLEAEIFDNAENITELVLDFRDLEYISSAGLRVLLAAQKRFAQTGGVTILDPNETVMEVFEMTGFAEILTIERKAG